MVASRSHPCRNLASHAEDPPPFKPKTHLRPSPPYRGWLNQVVRSQLLALSVSIGAGEVKAPRCGDPASSFPPRSARALHRPRSGPDLDDLVRELGAATIDCRLVEALRVLCGEAGVEQQQAVFE
jgi:hypothetical protein